jgi:hypothetical protein
MRVLIAGVLVLGGMTSACTQGTRGGMARYSADANSALVPVAVRRTVPKWPLDAASGAQAPAVASVSPGRTVAREPIVLSSRTSPAAVASPAPLPAPRVRAASEIAARLRPINATCPVLLGSPIDPSVTTSYNGRVIAFADVSSRSRWLADPAQYARNLPGVGGFGSATDAPVFATAQVRPLPSYESAPPRVSAPLASPELPAFSMPTAPVAIPSAPSRPAYATPSAIVPVAPVQVSPALPPAPMAQLAPALPAAPAATPPAAPLPAKSAPVPTASADADAGGTCEDCPGGNCKLPPRRK